MVRKAASLWLVLLWVTSPAAGQDWAREMFERTSHDFGSVARHAKAEHRFVFTNLYVEDVHVADVKASCGCTTPTIVNPSVKTYQQGAIVATFNTGRFTGSRSATITVTIDRPFPATVRLHVKGHIRTDVTLEPGGVVLGDIDQGVPVTRAVTVTRTGRPGWKILEVRSANPHLSGKVIDTRSDRRGVKATVQVRVGANAPPGYIRDHLMLVTNESAGSTVPVQVEGRVLPAVTVSPESLFLGVVHPGDKVTRQVVVRAKRPFRVTAVTSDDSGFQLNTTAEPLPKPLHVIPITFIAGNEPGRVEQTIRIETDMEDVAPKLSTLAVVEP